MPHRHRIPFPSLMLLIALVAPGVLHLDRPIQGQAVALAAASTMPLAQAETTSPEPPSGLDSDAASRRGVSWWPWLVAVPGLGLAGWWVMGKAKLGAGEPDWESQLPAMATGLGEGVTQGIAPDAPAILAKAERRIILVPRSGHTAYAYWELPTPEVEALTERQCRLSLKVHDVTGIAQVDQQPPHATEIWDCPTQAVGDLHLSVAQEDREYLLELGYRDQADIWHALVRSETVQMPSSAPGFPTPSDIKQTPDAPPAATVAHTSVPAATAIPDAAPSFAPEPAKATATLTAQTCRSAQAHWKLLPEQLTQLAAGNHRLTLHLYDVTELPGGFSAGPNSMQTFEVDPVLQAEQVLPIAIDDRDYLIEVGYMTENGQWQVLAKSSPVRVPACSS